MKRKIETAIINSAKISVDVSFLQQTGELFFNATDMARPFGKTPAEWIRLPDTEAYIDAILNMGLSHILQVDDIIKTKRGRDGGTWLHQDLGLGFARWLSPLLAVKLDRWTRDRLKEEMSYRESRLEAKTGFRPMTKAIADSHEVAKHYHYSNEVNLLYRIVIGVTAKEFCKHHNVNTVRDYLTPKQLDQLNQLQTIDTGLILMGCPYEVRKETLQAHHDNRGIPQLLQATG